MEIKPVNWRQFRAWNLEKQKEYLDALDEQFSPTASMYAAMFNTTANAVSQYRCRHGLGVGKRGKKIGSDPEAWKRFLNADEPVKEEPTLNDLMKEAAKIIPEGAEIHVVYRW